ncbi:hypothetical protein C6501_03010 [Candidatus Poribacteria bacterium]|nr:MAG: hypothetical protein C6501_03010 [Candidatus Poribacteria bacterium]
MDQNRCRIRLKSVVTRTTQLLMGSMFAIVLVLNFTSGQTAIAQKMLVQTGFEEFTVGKPPKDWEVRGDGFEVTNDTVKTDKKSLAILGGANDDRVGITIETDNPIVSVEFWVYIKSGGRSFNFKVVSSDNINQNDGGVYVNWNANAVRLFDGGAWRPIDDFDTDTWKYVRVVADVSKSEFDFYAGDDRNDALKAKGEKKLPFRNVAVNPVAKWVVFHVYTIAAPGYVDDLLVYEGDEPINLAVEPTDKLATVWGYIKHH